MFNGYADIDRAYLDERFERIDAEEGRMVSFPEDKLALEEQIGYRGPPASIWSMTSSRRRK